jgi:small subunit ribosomal protein S17
MADDENNEIAEQAAAAPEEAAGPASVLKPKERRQKSRAAKAAKTPERATSTPAERHEQRVVERRAKAVARRSERAQRREKAKANAHSAVATSPREHEQGTQKTRQGVVVSDKADKTITVRIDVARRHRRYAKVVRTSNTVHAHDESNDAHIGDIVVVRESRPLSRSKRWRLVEVVERAK